MSQRWYPYCHSSHYIFHFFFSFYLPIFFKFMFIFLLIYLFIFPLIYLFIFLLIYLFIYLFFLFLFSLHLHLSSYIIFFSTVTRRRSILSRSRECMTVQYRRQTEVALAFSSGLNPAKCNSTADTATCGAWGFSKPPGEWSFNFFFSLIFPACDHPYGNVYRVMKTWW